MSEAKRLYVGGLAENITEEELCDRFNRFGDVTNIDVRSKHDILGRLHDWLTELITV